MLSDFGHTHILTVHEKIGVKRFCFKADVASYDKMLLHLIYGSTQIFRWFAQLVDLQGNAVPYDPTTPTGSLKALMDQLITGVGTQNNDGILNPAQIVAAFQQFKNVFDPGSIELQETIDQLAVFLDFALRQGAIPLMAWLQLMKMHQEQTYTTYLHYRKVYKTDKCDRKYKKYVAAANIHIKHMIDGGRQLGAFWIVLLGCIVFGYFPQ